MDSLAFGLCLVLGGLASYQVILTILFARRCQPEPSTEVDDASLPKTTILLALRGADPDLADSLTHLAHQNYPDYELHIVVDSPSDPAWSVVQQVIDDTGTQRIQVLPLNQRPDQCSLHCASLVQLAKQLDASCDVFVLADGDMVAYPDWLRDLVSPLADPQVDATTGNRWYMPGEGRWGSLVRYVWNSAAVVSMYWFRIPWGGTFAGRTRDMRESNLVGKWERCLAVDAPIRTSWAELGRTIHFVPKLIMTNREECHLASCMTFLSRQLMWTRLYQPQGFWRSIVAHAFVTSGSLLAATTLAIVSLILGDIATLTWAASGVGIYLAAMLISLALTEMSVRRVARAQGEPTGWMTPVILAKLVAAIPLTQLIHLAAIVRVLVSRRVHWRGIIYEIKAPFDVRKTTDQPFRTETMASDSVSSL